MMHGPVERFRRVEALRSEAREHAKIMNGDGPGHYRDQATAQYCDAVDKIMAELNDMADAGTLDEIAKFLEISFGGGQS